MNLAELADLIVEQLAGHVPGLWAKPPADAETDVPCSCGMVIPNERWNRHLADSIIAAMLRKGRAE